MVVPPLAHLKELRMATDADETLRQEIAGLLAGGLETEVLELPNMHGKKKRFAAG